MPSNVFVDCCLTRKCTKNPSDFHYTLFKYKTSIVLVHNGATLHLIKYFLMLKLIFPDIKDLLRSVIMGSVYITAFACTWMRAAALGSEELMRTGWEISMLCLLLSWAALWLTDRAVNEWRFLAFFFPSPLRWPKPFPLDGDALGEGPEEQGPNGAGSELGPGALAGIGLSISINCLAVSFNCEESRGEERGREL